MLARFTDTFWYPDGSLAGGLPARVFNLHVPVLAPLFADAAGAIPLANPTTTSPTGAVDFWAEEGEYWIHLDTHAFRVSVGSPDLNVPEIASSVMSTGVLAGGAMTVNAGNPAAVDIHPLIGHVTDTLTDPFSPTLVRVSTGSLTIPLDAPALTRTLTWWLMDSSGTVTQQAGLPTSTQSRTHLILGLTAQQAGSIFRVKALPVILQQPANQLFDLLNALGGFNIAGNAITPNGPNLSLDRSAGMVFAKAFNHYLGTVQTNDPHVSATAALAPMAFRYSLRNTLALPAPTTLVDPTMYDNAGVLTPVGGGINTSTVQRVWIFPDDPGGPSIGMQYGQRTYGSLASAVSATGRDNFVPNPLFVVNGSVVAYVVVTRAATDLSDPTQATIVTAPRFSTT